MSKIVVIAIKHPSEPHLFLHGLRSVERKWALPGGHASPGETSLETITRELQEETGLSGVKLDKVHEQTYGDNRVVLFTGTHPHGAELNSSNDPDSEFTTFKFLDPNNHENMHVPKKHNILTQWIQGNTEEPKKKSSKTPLHWSSGYLAHKSQAVSKSENLTKNEPYSGGPAKQAGFSTHGEWKPMSVMHHLEAEERGNSWHVPAHMMDTHEALWVTHKKTSRYGNQYQEDLTGAVPVMSDGDGGHLYARPKQNTHKSAPGSIPLVHYSTTPGLKAIDPTKMGTGAPSQETKHGIPGIKRSFFYRSGTEPEKIVTQNSSAKYHLTLHPTHKIYDLATDPDKLVEQAVQYNQGAWNTDKILGHIKNSGYHGYHNSESSLPNVIALFHSHPVDRESNE